MKIRRDGQARMAGRATHRHIEGCRFGIVPPAKRDARRLRTLASRLLLRWQTGALAVPSSGARRLAS